MKKLKPFILILGLAVSTTLFFAGCSEGDHAGHDHDAEGHGEDHAAHGADAGVKSETAGVAGKVADALTEIEVIENPTAEQIAAAKPYTLETCVMSGEELGSMGDPIVVLVGDQQIKLCCDGCMDDLKADPAKALAKLRE